MNQSVSKCSYDLNCIGTHNFGAWFIEKVMRKKKKLKNKIKKSDDNKMMIAGIKKHRYLTK